MAYPSLANLKLHDDEPSSTGKMFSSVNETYKDFYPTLVKLVPGTEPPDKTPEHLRPLFEPDTFFVIAPSFDLEDVKSYDDTMIALNDFSDMFFSQIIMASASFDPILDEVVDYFKKTGTQPLSGIAGSSPDAEGEFRRLVGSRLPEELRRMIAMRIIGATEWSRAEQRPDAVDPLDTWKEPAANGKLALHYYNGYIKSMLRQPGMVVYEQIVNCFLFMEYNMTINPLISRIGEVALHFLANAVAIRVKSDTYFTAQEPETFNLLGLPAVRSTDIPQDSFRSQLPFTLRRVPVGIPYCDICARGGPCGQMAFFSHKEECVLAVDDPGAIPTWPDYGRKGGPAGLGPPPLPPTRVWEP